MPETFIAKFQKQKRIAIPQNYVELLKLKAGDKLRITIEKVK